MYANFYDKNNRCIYSVKVETELEAHNQADRQFKECKEVVDWTLTDKPISNTIIYY